MIDKTKKNLAAGITRVKWIATFLAERTKAETSMAKLFYEKSKIENKIDDLYRDIGRRVAELSEKGTTDIISDEIVQNALNEVKNLKGVADGYKKEVEKINKLRE